jgi:hypothetical protein
MKGVVRMAKVYLERENDSYIISNNKTSVYGTSSLTEMGIIESGVKDITISSTIEIVVFSSDILEYRVVQGFGSNVVIEDLEGNLIATCADVDGKILVFEDSVVDLSYRDGKIFLDGEEIEKIELPTDELSFISTTFSSTNNSFSKLADMDSEGVDSLVSGYYWDKDTITYSFNETIPSFYTTEELTRGFTPLDELQRDWVKEIIKETNSLLGITITEVRDGGDIRFSVLDMDEDTAGFAFLPTGESKGGDIFLSNSVTDLSSDGFGWYTVVHELGHALGLKHPFEGESPLPTNLDNTTHTVMSYTDESNIKLDFTLKDNGDLHVEYKYVNSQLYSIYDVSSLHAIYGSNTSTASGDNIYSFSYGDFIYDTIWDSGGSDTIDLSSTKGRSELDLNGGSLNSIDIYTKDEIVKFYQEEVGVSYFNDWIEEIVDELDGYEMIYSSNSIGIANGVIIENVIMGSGDDKLTDNGVDNIIKMGAGDDDVYMGAGGYDIVDGGEGSDTLHINDSIKDKISVRDYKDGYLLYTDVYGIEFKNIEIIILGDGSSFTPEELVG